MTNKELKRQINFDLQVARNYFIQLKEDITRYKKTSATYRLLLENIGILSGTINAYMRILQLMED